MRRHKLGTSALLLFTALVALRLALPHFLKTYVERTINKIPEYRCTVGDIDVALFRGAYKIKNFDLKKISANVAVPFFRADDADLSIQWGALFEGKLVGEINLTHPQLNFTAANAKKNNQMGIDSEWLDAVKDLFPLRINHFEVNQGEIHYRDFESNPKVDIKIVDAHVVANNLSNTRSPTNALEASINANAKVENTAALKVRSKVKPSEKTPTFVLEASLEKLPIVKVNDF